VLDEAQRNARLVELLVKSNNGRANLIISGTSLHGQEKIDIGETASCRCAQLTLPSLRVYEVLALLKALLGFPVTVKAWLDFWTLFKGDPYLYRQFEMNVLTRLDAVTKNKIAIEGMYNEDLLFKCSQILKVNTDTGESKQLTFTKKTPEQIDQYALKIPYPEAFVQ
jgi:hypothetical protein